MNPAENIKKLREQKGMLKKQVAAEIDLKPAHYNKIERGLFEPSVLIKDKLTQLFNITIDQIVHLEGNVPTEVIFKDKAANQQLKLIAQLNDKDRSLSINLIDTMLTK